MSAGVNRSPIRLLYDALCVLMHSDELHRNLEELEEYARLEGDQEPRFCEWAYEALSRRCLVTDLQRSTLRAIDIRKLAWSRSIDASLPVSSQLLLRQTLADIGIREPEVPPQLADGILVLRRFREWAEAELAGMPKEQLEPDDFSRNPVAACRRATERFLKLIVVFLYDGGLANVVLDEWSLGTHGFQPRPLPDDPIAAVMTLEAGPLNHLLRAISRSVQHQSLPVPFLRRGSALWSESVFNAVEALTANMNDAVHDRGAQRAIHSSALARQSKAVANVLLKIQMKEIRVPVLIQFFRRFTDGHAMHYEGFSQEGNSMRCFEAGEYELHRPYLMAAATNPSSVDMVCVPVRDRFFEPI